ncbi:hypothetical protein BZL41_19865 [Pseudomonas sp. PIC25]|uniref:hypothetical protein n=1 Tax=Pseudomonas sp. PIC25 TaxID=1958773 RepID=UPI000BABE4B0|nr:hypothetical protein [Pseudomonas sp. PIC25]PAU56672.1 hypothetical protein BZL41_19865 [Pseudomonas sp. PIC25]
MAGTWAALANEPPASIATTLLLTDGSVLAQGVSTNQWYRLRPDSSGNYVNGTWTTLAASVHAPLYYASGILRDGRAIVAGGEYDAGALVWLLNVEAYDPVANTWTTLPNPAGWTRIGDAPGCVLPDGRFFLGQVGTRRTAIYNPATNAWTAAADKINAVGEESWSLLPDGSIHAVDCSNPPNAEKYIIAANTWVADGTTPQTLVDSISEIGASVLLPDGRLFVIGATGFTALYTPPPIANQVGTWVQGPSIPQVNPGQPLGAVDAPACLLPNGNVLFTVGPITVPATFQAPTFFFEYDPDANTISPVPAAATSSSVPYWGRMLMLPTGQVLYTAGKTSVQVYTPSGSPDSVWRPTITDCPGAVRRGRTYRLLGRQINGLSQCVYYGNDATQATNYPIVRLESGGSVYYCRTSNFSTMGLQTGTVIHGCDFTVPTSVPDGSYCLRVIANGIRSACRTVSVTSKFFKELKYEIKEKLEILENIKAIQDARSKRIPDFIDPKLIREDIDIFERIQDEWAKSLGTLAAQVDRTHLQLSRAFIGPEERPLVGPPEPVVEKLDVPKISEERARRESEKTAFNDGRKELAVSKEAERIHRLIHAISRSGGKGIEENGTAGRKPGSDSAKPTRRKPKKS